MYRDVELRKLPMGLLFNIADILETNDDWKRVMCIIPKDPTSEHFEPKYNNEHIRLIEDHAKVTSRKCAEILFDEWGTSGRVRPTLSILKEIALKANIYRAADEIAKILEESLPVRPLDGPAAAIDTNVSILLNNERLEEQLNAMDSIKKFNFTNSSKQTDNHDRAICNRTTRQMKSASDLIQFSVDMDSADLPRISALQALRNKTTAQMKSESDLIKFSMPQTPIINIEEPSLKSVNIPHLSAIMSKTHVDRGTSNITPLLTQTNTESSQGTNNLPQINSSEAVPFPSVYQMSLPNIDLYESASSGIDSLILQDANLIHFKYSELESITNKFSVDLTKGPNGLTGRIGSGGFGEVFVGYHYRHGALAVKKAQNQLPTDRKPDIAIKVFNAEVKYLSQFRHKNIVPILGFSKDGPALCIVCEYIDGGSLDQKLAAKILTEKQRIDIMLGTAEGLKYLHRSEKQVPSNDLLYRTSESDSQNSSKKNNFVHGDVKSANILLTKDCIPKLCDFGLAKQFDTTFITISPMGTLAYMAPEGLSGTITQKIDIYSYGIVLLELLTGLRSIVVNNSEKINIKDFIEEKCLNNDITNVLDPVVGKWTKADEIYNLAKSCLEYQRKKRPSIDEICDILYKINGDQA